MFCNRNGLLNNWCRNQIEALHEVFQVQIFTYLIIIIFIYNLSHVIPPSYNYNNIFCYCPHKSPAYFGDLRPQ